MRKIDFKETQGLDVLKEELPGTETVCRFQNNPLRDADVRRRPRPKILPSQVDEMEDIKRASP
jgi:hypothetical protein